MPIGNIDYDRGVIINSHPGTGMDVFMYVDQPGKFLNAHSGVVPDSIAKEAGYDVERLGKERLKMDRKAQAVAAIEKELSDEKEIKEDVVEERGGFKLVSIGLGRHLIYDSEGNKLTNNALPLEAMKKVFDVMAGPVEVQKPSQNQKNGK